MKMKWSLSPQNHLAGRGRQVVCGKRMHWLEEKTLLKALQKQNQPYLMDEVLGRRHSDRVCIKLRRVGRRGTNSPDFLAFGEKSPLLTSRWKCR